jgi:hypothetical protein
MTQPISIPDRNRTHFRKNFSHLRVNYPELYEKILTRCPEIGLIRARNGDLTLKIRGRFIESPYDPLRDAARPVAEELTPTKRTLIYLGSGLGYRINGGPHEPRGVEPAILVERDIDVFRAALYIIEPQVLQHLVLLIDLDVKQVERRLSNIVTLGAVVIEHDRSVQLHREYYHAVRQIINRRIREKVASEMTTRATMRRWISNVVMNLMLLSGRSYTTKSLRGAFSGPVILVASGPYLEEAADTLTHLSKRLPVISLLPSVPFLRHRGIEPDFAVTTDAGFWNRYRLVRGQVPPLIAAYSADPVLLNNWGGKRFLFSHDLPVERLVPAIAESSLTIPMQGTSAVVMILLARLMGFTELLLTGFDFAFKGHKDHHRGGGFESLIGSRITRLQPWSTALYLRMRAEGVVVDQDCFGKPIASSHKLLLYRNWFEREISCRGLRRLNNGTT